MLIKTKNKENWDIDDGIDITDMLIISDTMGFPITLESLKEKTIENFEKEEYCITNLVSTKNIKEGIAYNRHINYIIEA